MTLGPLWLSIPPVWSRFVPPPSLQAKNDSKEWVLLWKQVIKLQNFNYKCPLHFICPSQLKLCTIFRTKIRTFPIMCIHANVQITTIWYILRTIEYNCHYHKVNITNLKVVSSTRVMFKVPTKKTYQMCQKSSESFFGWSLPYENDVISQLNYHNCDKINYYNYIIMISQ